MDALITCETRKTLSDLYRQFVQHLDPKTAADFFRESPWEAEGLNCSRRQWMLMKMLAFAQVGLTSIIKVSVDDSLGKKDKATRYQEAVDFQHNHQHRAEHAN